ncbi:MAG: MBOAT family protein [Oscillospiraceae bacterium]|nr:MBOAT family protein [Oscillospiraceae bacterium]
MVFSSLSFLYFFLPAVVLVYYLWNNRTYRNTVLLFASLFFYAWGEPKYILVMLLSVLCAYIGGLMLHGFHQKGKNLAAKLTTVLTVSLITGLLLHFKYLNLFAKTIEQLFSRELHLPEILLPIGISFYTFQILSYVIDLYRGKVELQKNFFYLLLYVCFFPQLIAGPIVRYETVERELRHRKENWEEFIAGLERFIFGLAKKVLLANSFAKLCDELYALGLDTVGTLFSWVAVVAYSLQIYFDFSGYSDMAIGLGRIFGFHFNENFNHPYTATSVTDFWRRWHISLSTWFRDYIYIPLGGNRVSPLRHCLNIFITWALTGFWHGAQWSFLLWGLYYAVLLLLEKHVLAPLLRKLPGVLTRIYTLLLVVIGWVIFRNERISEILTALKALFSFSPASPVDVLASNSQLVPCLMMLPFGILFSFPVGRKLTERNTVVATLLREVICILLLLLCIAGLLSSTYNPFIYFRF